MGETKVDYRHLLENLRDAYRYPIEEVIVVELVANALDAGATEIDVVTEPDELRITVTDNGEGMGEKELESYHDIAATTKRRGRGIGFAGVGAKLALLVAQYVVTETRNGGYHAATHWRLKSRKHAPWDYAKPFGYLEGQSGTAVSLVIKESGSALLSDEFVNTTLRKHFYPFLHSSVCGFLSKHVYKHDVTLSLNGRAIERVELKKAEFFVEDKAMRQIDSPESAEFVVSVGKRKKLSGVGFVAKTGVELPEEERGIALSTYGKVIKRGWEWLDIRPRNPGQVRGLVEVPDLVAILTTDKSDFLRTPPALNKYYKYRKAIQSNVNQVLRKLGELEEPKEQRDRNTRSEEKEINRILADLIPDFPELGSFMGRRGRGQPETGIVPDPDAQLLGTLGEGAEVLTGTEGGAGAGEGVEAAPGDLPQEQIEPSLELQERGSRHEGRRRRAALQISHYDNPDDGSLGRLIESTLEINEGHPAYRRAENTKSATYHTIFTVALVLSAHLGEEKSAQDFISRFLAGWGSQR